MTASDVGVAELLYSLHFGLYKARVRWDELERTKAPRFRSFAFFSKREEAVSKMVAALLDPSGAHGQGTLFLDIFIDNISGHTLNHLRQKEVRSIVVEDRTTLRRRIDIVVYFNDGFQLGIENKVFGAREQPNQISDYVDELDRRVFGRFALLFLHSEGARRTSLSEAKQKDMEEQNKLILEPAKPFLSSWIKECDDHCKAETVREFLHSFRKYIEHPPEERFMETDDTRELVTAEILRSTEAIEAAFAVCAHIRSAKDLVLNGLMTKTYQTLKERLKGSDMKSSEWAMSQSRTLWPADEEQQPRVESHPSTFQGGFGSNEWRYIGIVSNSSPAISVELEMGFNAKDIFNATIGIHKTGDYERHGKAWIRGSNLDSNQETRLHEALQRFEGLSYFVINSRSLTAEDWHWSRDLDSAVVDLNSEAIQKLFRAWTDDTDPFIGQLTEMLLNLAKVAHCAAVNGNV